MTTNGVDTESAKHDDSDDGLVFAPDLPTGITKEILKSAQSDSFGRPNRFDDVTFHYIGIEPSVDIEFATSGKHEPITIRLGREKTSGGLELAIMTMRRGERSKFTMNREFCLASDGNCVLPCNLPDAAQLVFEIELISYLHRKDLFGNGTVIKTLIATGSGTKPKLDDEVILSYKAVLIQTSETLDEKKNFEYKLGSGSLGRFGAAVDKALCSMRKGSSVSLECTPDYAPDQNQEGAIIIDLCLEEIYQIEDVSWGRSRVALKKRIREGNGDLGPQEGDVARLSVESVTDGSATLAGFSGPCVLEFTWGDGEICEVLELAVGKMSKFERAIITCSHPALCSDKQLGLADIQAKSVVFTVELVDFQEGTLEIVAPDARGKLDFACARKDVGSRFFKEQRYRMAFARYAYAVKLLHDNFTTKGDYAAEIEELETACQLNQAACLLKMGDTQGAISACSIVLDRRPRSVKALFRRASAHHTRGEYLQTIRDLKQAIDIEPQNVEARRLLQQAKQAQREEDNSSKSVFAKMIAQNDQDGAQGDCKDA